MIVLDFYEDNYGIDDEDTWEIIKEIALIYEEMNDFKSALPVGGIKL